MRVLYVPALDQRFTVGHQWGELWMPVAGSISIKAPIYQLAQLRRAKAYRARMYLCQCDEWKVGFYIVKFYRARGDFLTPIDDSAKW